VYPTLNKAKEVRGSALILRNAVVDDAEFILSLRLDPTKSRFLSATPPTLQDQVAWLDRYQSSSNQAYFVICDHEQHRLGCVRMYDPVEYSYCWGSWLMVGGLSPLFAIESALLIYAYGKYSGFKQARIDVRKENTSVWKFHEKFSSAARIHETDIDFFYLVTEHKIDRVLNRYSNMISDPLAVLQ